MTRTEKLKAYAEALAQQTQLKFDQELTGIAANLYKQGFHAALELLMPCVGELEFYADAKAEGLFEPSIDGFINTPIGERARIKLAELDKKIGGVT